MMRLESNILFFCLLIISTCQVGLAQELECRVIINATQVQTTERRVFTEMEEEFTRFINERKWTDDKFSNQEKIRCGIMISLEAKSEGSDFFASVQIVSNRPAFNTIYESPVLNFGDRDFAFEYNQSQSLNYSDNTFTSNITSLLAYYAYIFLAFDYDTFSQLGGEQYYQKAQQIVTSAQQSGYDGWDQFGSTNNRYWLSKNTLDRLIKPYREAMYQYHRLGLDILIDEPEQGRENILGALEKIGEVNRVKPRSVVVINFIDAKAEELINIFSEGDLAIRREAYDLLKTIAPSRTEDFKKILTN